MGKLEETLQEAPVLNSVPKERESYEGLQLTDSQKYKGGTSIKYRM